MQWASVTWLDGLPAAMFLLLVGSAWTVSRAQISMRVVRRAAGLFAIGLAFWHWVWPNDILMPIALMMLVLGVVHAWGSRWVATFVVVTFAFVPLATWWWGDYAWTDGREDGTHAANHELGWVTLRYFLFDGAYPLLPWLALPLLGTLLANVRDDARALSRCMVGSAAAMVAALAVSMTWGDAQCGGIYAHLDITWQPTSLPFMALWGGAAVFAVAALMRWLPAVLLPAWRPIAVVGRTSLTHYLLHTVVVYGALRIWWPEEDWSAGVGVSVAVGYVLFALVVTPWWLRTLRHGPVEALLSWCSATGVTQTAKQRKKK